MEKTSNHIAGKVRIFLQDSSALGISFCIASFLMVLSFNFDIWWHKAIGRDTFFIIPHILAMITYGLSTGTAFLLFRATAGLRTHGENRLTKFAFAGMAAFALGFLFDEAWHRILGKETLDTPFIVWGPPHVVMTVAFLFAQAYFLRFLLIETALEERIRLFLTTVTFALFWSALAGVLLMPLAPLGHYGALGIFWGAFLMPLFLALPFAATSEYSGRFLPFWGLFAGITWLCMEGIRFTRIFSPFVRFPPKLFDMPLWIDAWAILTALLVLHVFLLFARTQGTRVIAGLSFGLVYGVILYTSAGWWFSENEFPFQLTHAAILAMSALSAAGGGFAFFVANMTGPKQ